MSHGTQEVCSGAEQGRARFGGVWCVEGAGGEGAGELRESSSAKSQSLDTVGSETAEHLKLDTVGEGQPEARAMHHAARMGWGVGGRARRGSRERSGKTGTRGNGRC